ncbi:MAG: hypothetical protein LBJ00_05865 [Planctomycetaceae bacterium]|nr:hypothetical protein [Planctomycetaceae bacterium]
MPLESLLKRKNSDQVPLESLLKEKNSDQVPLESLLKRKNSDQVPLENLRERSRRFQQLPEGCGNEKLTVHEVVFRTRNTRKKREITRNSGFCAVSRNFRVFRVPNSC